MNERDTLKINNDGHLEIGGADCVELAKQFGTPLYVFDEAYIRKMIRIYRNTILEKYNGNGLVLYASKAFSCKHCPRSPSPSIPPFTTTTSFQGLTPI